MIAPSSGAGSALTPSALAQQQNQLGQNQAQSDQQNLQQIQSLNQKMVAAIAGTGPAAQTSLSPEAQGMQNS